MAPKKARNLGQDAHFIKVVDSLAGGYKTVGQMVYAVLREAILSGAFAPGEWLRQESLAEAIGVSRIPVRTALLQLESEGLVEFHPHRGARIRLLSMDYIDELYRLRVLLETDALRVSLRSMTPARLGRLQELAEQLDETPETGEFLDLRLRFYRELYDAEHNPLLVEVIEDLRSHVARYLLRSTAAQLHLGDHVDLVEYLRTGDVESARGWLTGYLERARRYIRRVAEDDAASAAEAVRGGRRHGSPAPEVDVRQRSVSEKTP